MEVQVTRFSADAMKQSELHVSHPLTLFAFQKISRTFSKYQGCETSAIKAMKYIHIDFAGSKA